MNLEKVSNMTDGSPLYHCIEIVQQNTQYLT